MPARGNRRAFVFVIALACGAQCAAQAPPYGPYRAAPTRPGRTPAQLRAALQQVDDTVAAAERRSDVFRTCFPLARLALKKAELAQPYAGAPVGSYVEEGFEFLARLERGEEVRAKPGTVHEGAYVAANDGTVQPYFLYLPEQYKADCQWPLIVFLHGYVPSISVLRPWVLGETTCSIAARYGCAVLIPYGRRNTDFQGVGEIDVLETIDLVTELYALDPDRVLLSGTSMGGAGAWNLMLRHPGRFAGAAPISGQTDMHAWWPRVLPDWPAKRSDLIPFRRFMVEWDNPVDFPENARGQAIFVQHGELDHLIPVEQSREMVRRAAGKGIRIFYHEFVGQGHYIYWDDECFVKSWRWLARLPPPSPPQHLSFTTYSLEYNRAFYVTVTDFEQWGIPAHVECRIPAQADTHFEVAARNVAAFEIDVRACPIPVRERYVLVVNGRRRELPVENGERLVWRRPRTQPEQGDARPVPPEAPDGEQATPAEPPAARWPPRKRHGLSGPIEEAFDTPFLGVVGTDGGEELRNRAQDNAARWAREWDAFADGKPRFKTDADVTEDDIQRFNLILFGTPESNSVLARMAAKLPVKIGDRSYAMGEESWEGPTLGLVFCYPNPLAPGRYVVVYSGTLYGERLSNNHKHDLLPDFLVFRGDRFSFDGTNEHVVGGFFDMNWTPAPRLTWPAAGPLLPDREAPAVP